MIERRKQDDAQAQRIAQRAKQLEELQAKLTVARLKEAEARQRITDYTNRIIGLLEN